MNESDAGQKAAKSAAIPARGESPDLMEPLLVGETSPRRVVS
jgi:hypothetical protein